MGAFDVAIDADIGSVQLSPHEPPEEGRIGSVQGLVPLSIPFELRCDRFPELWSSLQTFSVVFPIVGHGGLRLQRFGIDLFIEGERPADRHQLRTSMSFSLSRFA